MVFDPTPKFAFPKIGQANAPILVVCDAPNEFAARRGMPLSTQELQTFADLATPLGFAEGDFRFVGLCPQVAKGDLKSEARKWDHVQPYIQQINDLIAETNPEVVVTFGALATRAIMGKAMKVTKVSGLLQHRADGVRVFPLISPGFILRVPEHRGTLQADLMTLLRYRRSGWQEAAPPGKDYQWRIDIADIIASKPKIISVDTETTGLIWWQEGILPITVQISVAPGEAYAIPVDPVYWPELNDPVKMARVRSQLKELLEDQTILKVGHNIKFDAMMLRKFGIEVKGWYHDTMLLWAFLDENAMRKDLASAVKKFVPEMAGYSDVFDAKTDKSRMREVPFDEMLEYGCGDADATLRLAKVLDAMIRLPINRGQLRCYRRIQFPALLAFLKVVEPYGIKIDLEHLTTFTASIINEAETLERSLWSRIPGAVQRKEIRKAFHSGAKTIDKLMSLTRPDFIRDVLFSDVGFGLKPVQFTAGTVDLEPEHQIASTSAKTHMPYFITRNDEAGQFCREYVDFTKLSKLGDTYLGDAFAKYICPTDGAVHPFYKLHNTNTLRTSSEYPNGQNFPKRSRWAAEYQKLFIPRPGFTFVDCDLSQIELRIAAWEAMEPEMLRIYRGGGDIHTATAMVVMQITLEEWNALTPKEKKAFRTKAKACNFGFIYGMQWRTFQAYAFTDYCVNYTEKEAQEARELFFDNYPGLVAWHARKKRFAHETGTSVALHGATRHLPSIRSTDPAMVALAERQAVNAPVQRFGSDLGLAALARFSAQADPEIYRIVAFIHDALIMEVPIEMAEEGAAYLRWSMESFPFQEWFDLTPPLPILAEPSIANPEKPSLGNMIERPDIQPRKPSWWNDDEIGALNNLAGRLAA